MLCSRFLKPPPEKHGWLYRVIEAGFDGILAFYMATLAIALRHRFITLMVFFATVAVTGWLFVVVPKGFFPTQDIGLINGLSEAAQDVSPDEMKRLQQQLGEVIAEGSRRLPPSARCSAPAAPTP